MKQRPARTITRDKKGVAAIEFGMTAPLFLLLIVGIAQCGIALWYQFGMEHGAEMAARCATVTPTDPNCDTAAHLQSYAAQQTYGAPIPVSAFTVSLASTCDSNGTIKGNRINASYVYKFAPLVYQKAKVTLTARSCFPT
jgi:Flp pilus assembly protein TadG